MRNKNKIKKYYLTPTYPEIYLSRREAQCVAYFLKGFSNRIIGQILGLSIKTVDSYAASAKRKLKCRTKAELIAKIYLTHFAQCAHQLIT